MSWWRSRVVGRGCVTAIWLWRCATTVRSGLSRFRLWCVFCGRMAGCCLVRVFRISRRRRSGVIGGAGAICLAVRSLRCVCGGAFLRAGSASAWPVGSEGCGDRSCSAQYRGFGAVCSFQSGLRVVVEHAGGGSGRVGRQPDEVGRGGGPADRLLGGGGPHAGRDRRPLCAGDGVVSDVAGVGVGFLAVQVALPGPGGAARGGARVQASRSSACR